MSCDKPSGDCTNVSPCGNSGCGCSSATPSPILPRCQDVSLTPGVFERATIVVNANGCISSITEGEPELYTPDECCGGEGGGGGSGEQGPPGPAGEDGAAATIAVVPTIETGTAGVWSVENIGTQNAAIFKFTAPASTGGGGGTTSGVTGTLNGFTFDAGLVKTIPSDLVTRVTAGSTGNQATLFQFTAVPNLSFPGRVDFNLNLDAFYSDLNTKFQDLHDAQAEQILDLTSAVADLTDTITSLQNTLAGQQSTIAALQQNLSTLQSQHGSLLSRYNSHTSHPPPA